MRNISRPAVAYGGKAPGRALVINASSITIVELQAGLLQAGIVLVGVAYSFDEALRMIDDFAPDILFIDILLAGRAGSGISFLSEVTASGFPIV
jgi:AmiR/NasT family two-component response regulator